MDLSKYRYQVPVLFNKSSIMDYVDGFGKSVYKKEFKEGIFFDIEDDLFFTKSVELFNVFDTYAGIQLYNEAKMLFTIFVKIEHIKEVEDIVAAQEDGPIGLGNISIIPPDENFIKSLRELAKLHLLKEYKETINYISINEAEPDIDPEELQKALIETIDETYYNVAKPIWQLDNDLKTYYIYQPIPSICGICIKDDDSNILIRFIFPEEASVIMLANAADVFDNYWLKASKPQYKKTICLLTETAILKNKLEGIKFMLNVLGIDETEKPLNFFKNLRFKKKLKQYN